MHYDHCSIVVCPDLVALGQTVARRWQELATQAHAASGQFHVALSGGTTPRYLYTQLASRDLSAVLPWAATHIYFGDERCVPPDDKDSNFRLASETLLQHVPIPQQQIHRIEAENPAPELCAIRYEKCLEYNLPTTPYGRKYLDLVLLGLGPDGHIASLFPDSDILHEQTKLVAAVFIEKMQTWRISLTFTALGLARNIIVLVAGDNKAEIIAQVLGNKPHTKQLPVEMLHDAVAPEWYLDAAAAALLPDMV
jgi:6-phosphogluconolactonase